MRGGAKPDHWNRIAEKLREALTAGAAGVQVGTAFAFCAESGLRDDYKQALLKKANSREAKVFTDPLASPTGYPFKAAQLEGTVSEREVYLARPRICDLAISARLTGPQRARLIIAALESR